MSLRSKLILAFMALVSLLVGVGVTSFVVNRRVQSEVADLRSSRGVDLRRVETGRSSLEVEGFWDPAGSFVATEVEMLPGTRRPKLRGEIQALDELARTATLFGVPVRVTADTEFIGSSTREGRFEDLKVGQRIEVNGLASAGRWTARKIKTQDIKPSDKIKGTVTAADLDGEAPETVEFMGIVVSLSPSNNDSPQGLLRRVELATQMTLLLQESRAAAHELVGRTVEWEDPAGGSESDRDVAASTSAGERLSRSQADFEHDLEESGRDGEHADPNDQPSPFAPLLRSLTDREVAFRDNIRQLRQHARVDPERARAFLDEKFDPFLQDELLPILYAYRSEAEQALADQVNTIATRTDTTTRVTLATGAVAPILALVLGALVWRSIHPPIRALEHAALRLGQGHLDTRVDVHSRDELGVLADTFNQMARDLAATTVTVSSLENVFDSMAGALLILDTRGSIATANKAAQSLLGYDRDEIVGLPLETVCAPPLDHPIDPIVATSEDGIATVAEKLFVRKDGDRVPVSFSGAELRSEEGPPQGFVCVAQDLSERKRIEERLRSSLAEKELLLREVHHRVKNNMQVVSSLLAIQSAGATDAHTRDLFEQSQNRIRSMALIHEQLYSTSTFNEVDLGSYLELLTAHLLQSLDPLQRASLELKVDAPSSDTDRAIACGLIVSELVTNSLKHAFPDDRPGTIRVSLTVDEGKKLVLSVEDDGRGLSEPPASRPSPALGLTLVEQLAKQFDARVSFAPEPVGTCVRVVFPAALPKDVTT